MYEADEDGDKENWYNHYEGEDCDHEDYEISWEGRATCGRCSHSWWASRDQIEADDRWRQEYAEYEAEQHRLETVWWRRAAKFLGISL